MTPGFGLKSFEPVLGRVELAPLQVNDRVARVRDFDGSDMRHGVVVEVYEAAESNGRPGEVQHAVRWNDTGQVERGYLRLGLIFEGRNVT